MVVSPLGGERRVAFDTRSIATPGTEINPCFITIMTMIERPRDRRANEQRVGRPRGRASTSRTAEANGEPRAVHIRD
jgi:hypothetical protein